MWLARTGFLLVLVAVAYVNCQDAPPCDPEVCQLPSCRCSNTSIPGGLEARDTPQFVILTFDDGVNVNNIQTYRSLLYNRRNKLNNCPAGVTFFVSHEFTDYTLVNELYNQGYEIGLHSITHLTNQEYWRYASPDVLTREFADQRIQMSHFANIPTNRLNGIRSPFLQMAGNSTFQMMANNNLRYDLSWPTMTFRDPGLWPYTLNYASIQDCFIFPCPTASVPGPWVIPIITWLDLQGFSCSFVDACPFNPQDDEEGWYKFILDNFERHYLNNRAPFGFYIHEWFINVNPALRRAFIRFLDTINNLNDVFMVNANEVIDWVQNPVPINEYAKQSCKSNPQAPCRATSCGPLQSEHSSELYYMRICNRCPRTYPWLNNPLGN